MEPTGLALKGALFLRQHLDRKWKNDERDWIDGCLIQASQTGETVLVALLAAEMGRQPLDDEVQTELARFLDDPSLLPRLHRLFSEILRSPSVIRRKRLAAVLVAGPKITKSDVERDQLDLLAEQLLEADLATLQGIVASFGDRPRDTPWTPLSFHVRLGATCRISWNHADTAMEADRRSVDRLAAGGCISQYTSDQMQVTALGEFLCEHMNHEAIDKAVAPALREEAP